MNTPNFRSFDLIACASASVAAYPDGWDEYRKGWPDGQLIRFDNDATDTHGFVALEDCRLLISFCGTKDLRNAVTDCRIKLKPCYQCGRVHSGFEAALDSVWDNILNAIRGRAFRKICVTGHSLGGAMAMLCAIRLCNAGIPVESVYTFGQPRVGDAAFRDIYNRILGQSTFRLVHRFDPVPWMPGLLIGYRHCGHEIFCDPDGNFSVDPPITAKLGRVIKELAAQPLFLFGPIAAMQMINNIKTACSDHSAKGYAALAAKVSQLTFSDPIPA